MDPHPASDPAPGPVSGEHLAEELADWLDRLGLGPHLAAAGLPTYERVEGVLIWTDPITGDPLSPDQLRQLDAVLRSQGEDPAHAVPLPLLQIARQARVRAELLESPWVGYDELARRRGASLEATRFAVHKASSERSLLVLSDGGRTVVPAFQLTPDGELREDLERALTPLLAAGMDPWKTWAWLTRPAALLGGAVPEVAVRDPEEAEVVVRAAVHLAARVVIGGGG